MPTRLESGQKMAGHLFDSNSNSSTDIDNINNNNNNNNNNNSFDSSNFNLISNSNSNNNNSSNININDDSTTSSNISGQHQRLDLLMPELLPELKSKSEILTQQHVKELSKHLSARADGYAWQLAFTTTHMGFSLKSLYRTLSQIEGPVLLIIKDTTNTVFGAFCSCPIQKSDSFYGTGETYLFTFKHSPNQIKRYPWSGDNLYFIKGESDSIVLGAGDGNFGLWLDEELYHGSSYECKTFNNEPLSRETDFFVSVLECWYFS